MMTFSTSLNSRPSIAAGSEDGSIFVWDVNSKQVGWLLVYCLGCWCTALVAGVLPWLLVYCLGDVRGWAALFAPLDSPRLSDRAQTKQVATAPAHAACIS
jgi:hypothetical protein